MRVVSVLLQKDGAKRLNCSMQLNDSSNDDEIFGKTMMEKKKKKKKENSNRIEINSLVDGVIHKIIKGFGREYIYEALEKKGQYFDPTD